MSKRNEIKQNLLKNIENIIANFSEVEKRDFERECRRKARSSRWCNEHKINYINGEPYWKDVIREVYLEKYMRFK